jgi:hypothetical protein
VYTIVGERGYSREWQDDALRIRGSVTSIYLSIFKDLKPQLPTVRWIDFLTRLYGAEEASVNTSRLINFYLLFKIYSVFDIVHKTRHLALLTPWHSRVVIPSPSIHPSEWLWDSRRFFELWPWSHNKSLRVIVLQFLSFLCCSNNQSQSAATTWSRLSSDRTWFTSVFWHFYLSYVVAVQISMWRDHSSIHNYSSAAWSIGSSLHIHWSHFDSRYDWEADRFDGVSTLRRFWIEGTSH